MLVIRSPQPSNRAERPLPGSQPALLSVSSVDRVGTSGQQDGERFLILFEQQVDQAAVGLVSITRLSGKFEQLIPPALLDVGIRPACQPGFNAGTPLGEAIRGQEPIASCFKLVQPADQCGFFLGDVRQTISLCSGEGLAFILKQGAKAGQIRQFPDQQFRQGFHGG